MKPIKTFDKERMHLNLAKMKKGGENFEVVIDPDRVIDFRNKKITDVREVLHYEKIFSDAKKGFEASHEHMMAIFQTDDVLVIAGKILAEGEIQFTQEYRDQKRKDKINRILDIIVRNAIDPRSGLPHPRVRIENAIEEAKVKIDEYKDAEDQVQHIVSALKPVLPIKMAMRELMVKIPPLYAGKAYSIVQRFGKILQDSWQSNGAWICTVEIPAGIQNEFFDELNKLTKGEVESTVLREK